MQAIRPSLGNMRQIIQITNLAALKDVDHELYVGGIYYTDHTDDLYEGNTSYR